MATFTYAQNQSTGASAASTTIGITLTLSAGSAVFVVAKHESTVGGAAWTCTSSAGGTYTGGTRLAHTNNDLEGQIFYCLSCNSGSQTITVTFPNSVTFRSIGVFEYTISAAVALDTETIARGTDATPSSGNITTAGDNAIVALYCEYVAHTSTSHQINSVNADHVVAGNTGSVFGPNFTAMWDRIVTTGFTGQATCSNTSAAWVCGILALKPAGGGGGGRTTHNTRSSPLGTEIGMGFRMNTD